MDLINKLLEELEKLQMPNGAFIAAPSEEYRACWIRDQLYCALCYYYLGNIEKLVKSIRVIFEILRKHWNKIEKDRELIKVLIFYLFTVEYWKKPDHGMWEDYLKVRSSSIGSVLTGLIWLDKET